MKFSAESLRRGLLKWNAQSSVSIFTATSDDVEEAAEWTGPHTDPNGSLVSSESKRIQSLRFETPEEGSASPPFPIRWERIDPSGCVVTTIVDPDPNNGRQIKLAHLPEYGTFHRLVIAADQGLLWEQDAVVQVGSTIVRLHTGSLFGERTGPFDQIEVIDGRISVTSDWTGTAEVAGRFIEIVAAGATEEEARFNAHTLLGFIALVFGDCVVGTIIFSELHSAEPGKRQSGKHFIPATVRFPQNAEEEGLDVLDRSVTTLSQDNPIAHALRLALRWLEKGIRSQNEIDQLISYFVAIEAILNAFVHSTGKVPKVEARQRAHSTALKALLRGKLDRETRDMLFQCLGYASAKDKFEYYRVSRKLDSSWDQTFRRVASQRNDLFHGRATSTDSLDFMAAKRLLVAMVKAELGITAQLPSERHPTFPRVAFTFEFKEYGYTGDDQRPSGK